MPNSLQGEEALARPGHRWSLRSSLVVAQISLSLILLCAAGLFLRSLENASRIDVGFRSRGLVIMDIDPQLHRYTTPPPPPPPPPPTHPPPTLPAPLSRRPHTPR